MLSPPPLVEFGAVTFDRAFFCPAIRFAMIHLSSGPECGPEPDASNIGVIPEESMANGVQLIGRELLDRVSSLARHSPRRRKNHNFHGTDEDACHRLLNAMEPDSYIPPHCHRDPSKDETILALRGRFGVVWFDSEGGVRGKTVLQAGSGEIGVDIPHGVFHTLVALAPDGVFFEAKAGPYRPLSPEEKAAWAPAGGEPAAPRYLAQLKALFD